MSPDVKSRLDQTENITRRYLNKTEDEPAVAAIMVVFRFLETMFAVARGESGPELARNAQASMLTLLLGLTTNPFVAKSGMAFYNTVGTSTMALLDSFVFTEDARALQQQGRLDDAHLSYVRAMAAQGEMATILVSAVGLWRNDTNYALECSPKIRRDMSNIK